MSNHLRVSEKWFNRGLWLIAFLFAYFLIGLGGTIVEDLPKIESMLSFEDFVDKESREKLFNNIKSLDQEEAIINEKLEQANLNLKVAKADYQTAKQEFDTWVTTRTTTQRSSQDEDLIKRTTNLDKIRKKEREQLTVTEAIQKQLLDLKQSKAQLNREIATLENAARIQFETTQKKTEFRVFIYRLTFILPLLIASLYLFTKHRNQSYWPFVWGFILFSIFAFFVELVPYLPSYGGYVHYTVGVIITLVAGKYAITALQKYIDKQREIENLPDSQRKNNIQYDLALSRIAKDICPSCERPINKENNNFCQHCGIEIFDKCDKCETRKIAFSKFCFHCGKKTEKFLF